MERGEEAEAGVHSLQPIRSCQDAPGKRLRHGGRYQGGCPAVGGTTVAIDGAAPFAVINTCSSHVFILSN